MDTPDYPHILTKENFWNDLQKKNPYRMKIFCDWIDEYKKRVDWDRLFNAREEFADEDKWDYEKKEPFVWPKVPSPKFHEIPVAMQIGIFFQFTTEHPLPPYPIPKRFDNRTIEGVINQIRLYFETDHL